VEINTSSIMDTKQGEIVFVCEFKEMLKLCANGDIYIRGVLATNDIDIVLGLKEWLKKTEK